MRNDICLFPQLILEAPDYTRSGAGSGFAPSPGVGAPVGERDRSASQWIPGLEGFPTGARSDTDRGFLDTSHFSTSCNALRSFSTPASRGPGEASRQPGGHKGNVWKIKGSHLVRG